MDAHSAVELGFADDILKRAAEDAEAEEDLAVAGAPMMFFPCGGHEFPDGQAGGKCRIQKQPEETGAQSIL